MSRYELFTLVVRLFNARDWERLITLWTEDCVWWPATVGGIEGDAGYHGRAGLREYLEQALADFGEFQMRPDHVEELGSVIFASGNAVARGRQSGATIGQPAAWVLDITDDGLVRRGFSSFDIAGARRRAQGWSAERSRPSGFRVMGVINVTPDSFSDGGEFLDAADAVSQGRRLIADGADILDVGGESTRPGAEPVGAQEEVGRVLPVIEQLAGAEAQISIDTTKSQVARAALEAGAMIVNDVSAFRFDPQLAALVAETGSDCCLMHMLGEPRTMQDDPRYEDVVSDVKAFLEGRIAFAVAEGVAEERIWVDPGIGFGKTVAHNLELLRRLDEIAALGRPVVIGTSRKSFLGKLTGRDEKHRLPGTIATNVLALERGARIFRVHDVAEVADALAVGSAVLGR